MRNGLVMSRPCGPYSASRVGASAAGLTGLVTASASGSGKTLREPLAAICTDASSWIDPSSYPRQTRAHALTRLHTVSTTRRAAILSIGCPVVTHQ